MRQGELWLVDAIEKYNCITSTQALTEFSNVCIKKLHIQRELSDDSQYFSEFCTHKQII
jgi:predicted nucleic acid-binding protein